MNETPFDISTDFIKHDDYLEIIFNDTMVKADMERVSASVIESSKGFNKTGKPLLVMADASLSKRPNFKVFGESVKLLGALKYDAIAIYGNSNSPTFSLIISVVDSFSSSVNVKKFTDKTEAVNWLLSQSAAE